MWRSGLLALTACWATAPSVTTTAPARCEIGDADIATADHVVLQVGGISFARIADRLTRFTVVIEGPRARAQLETAALELTSELELRGLSLRTRTRDLHDGWLGILDATVRRGSRGDVEIAVPLPPGVSPRVVHATVPCATVTFAVQTYDDDEPAADNELADDDEPDDDEPEIADEPDDDDDDELALQPGTRTALARTPGGAALVHLVPGAGHPLRVRILERTPGFARIELAERNRITGWVSTVHAREVRPEADMLSGFGRSGHAPRLVNCPHEVPIYVETPARVHHVGRYKPGVAIRYRGPAIDEPAGASDDLVRVDLGGGELEPHIRRADLARCTPGSPQE